MTSLNPPINGHSNLFSLLSNEAQPHKVIDFPRYKNGKPFIQVALVILNLQDNIKIQSLATLETDRIFKDEGKSLELAKTTSIYQDRYKNIAAKHFLMAAIRDPENVSLPFFPTPDDIAKYCTIDEVSLLVKEHARFSAECGPIIGMMNSEAEMQGWITRLVAAGKEGGYFLDHTLSEAKDELLMFMAHQLIKFQTDSFSAGSPHNSLSETTNESNPPPAPIAI